MAAGIDTTVGASVVAVDCDERDRLFSVALFCADFAVDRGVEFVVPRFLFANLALVVAVADRDRVFSLRLAVISPVRVVRRFCVGVVFAARRPFAAGLSFVAAGFVLRPARFVRFCGVASPESLEVSRERGIGSGDRLLRGGTRLSKLSDRGYHIVQVGQGFDKKGIGAKFSGAIHVFGIGTI